jgi:hypothetical protein
MTYSYINQLFDDCTLYSRLVVCVLVVYMLVGGWLLVGWYQVGIRGIHPEVAPIQEMQIVFEEKANRIS